MRSLSCRPALAGLTLGVVLAWAGSAAAAMDPKQAADALIAAATATGKSKGTYERATAAGTGVTVTNFRLTSEDGSVVTVPSVSIVNPTPRASGGFTADQINFDGGTVVEGKQSPSVTWSKASIDGAVVPSPAEIQAKARIWPMTKLSITGLSFNNLENVKQPVKVASVSAQFGDIIEGVAHDMKLAISGMDYPVAIFDEPEMVKFLGDAGYPTGPNAVFSTSLTIDGAYDSPTDTLNIRNFVFDTRDVGKLSISGVVSGVPLSKLADPEKAKELLATAKLASLSVRFDNAGIVDRVMAMTAKKAGVSPADYAAQLTAALPLMLNVIGNPAFQDKLAAAAATFLTAPKSISVSAKPSGPVPVVQIVGAAMSAPGTLPDVMAVDVTANQ